MSPRLGVLVDGEELPEADARALWARFSTWMEEHKGDLLGFARAEGYASIHPGVAGGRPVLLASRSAVQKPYAPVREDVGPGSGKGGPSPPRGPRGDVSGSSPKQDGGSGSRQSGPGGRRPDRPKSRRK